jgi:hypothetical protein
LLLGTPSTGTMISAVMPNIKSCGDERVSPPVAFCAGMSHGPQQPAMDNGANSYSRPDGPRVIITYCAAKARLIYPGWDEEWS